MSETTTSGPAPVSGARRGAATAFAYVAALLVLGVLVQVFLAGLGVFDLDGRTIEQADSFDPHVALGHILSAVALVMLILAIVARTSKFAIWGSLLLVVLIEVAQTALASGGEDHPWLGGLHALDGMIILLLGLALHLTSRRSMASTA